MQPPGNAVCKCVCQWFAVLRASSMRCTSVCLGVLRDQGSEWEVPGVNEVCTCYMSCAFPGAHVRPLHASVLDTLLRWKSCARCGWKSCARAHLPCAVTVFCERAANLRACSACGGVRSRFRS